MKYFTTLFILSCSTPSVSAQIIRVPAQHATIGAALAAAGSGTTILVAAGTYRERLTWPQVDGIRLRSEEGPTRTTIDASGRGRVIDFDGSRFNLTRLTILEGFTITNGRLSQINRHTDYGAGIRVINASPTIRRNRIYDNIVDDHPGSVQPSRGAGILVWGHSNPFLATNEIDNNEIRPLGRGAGIYLDKDSKADIVRNNIRNNRIPWGEGAGIYSEGRARIASNMIVDNASSHGGGLFFGSTSNTRLLNNTISGNSCTAPISAGGGGIFVDYQAGAVIRGNIIVGNSVTRARNPGAGGIEVKGARPLSMDYNNVWGNIGGNYANLTPGKNSISLDPRFVSSTDRHLMSSSPCIDAIPASHSDGAGEMDMDLDPRRVDGDLDGNRLTGARMDIGADEFTGVRLWIGGTQKPGARVSLTVTASRTSLCLLAADVQTGNTFLSPWGNLLLTSNPLVVWVGTTPASLWGLWPRTGIVSSDIYFQALVMPTPLSGLKGQFTNRVRVAPY